MSEPNGPPRARRPDPRAAALAAAEARTRALTQPSAEVSASCPGGSSSGGGGVAGIASPISSPSAPPTGLFSSGGSGSASPRFQPTEKEERDCRIKFSRLLDRGLVRDNPYKQVADCVETLLQISSNIQNSSDPKFRDLKENNKTLQTKVLSLKGGHDYLIALGFRVATIDFTRHYIFQSSIKSSWELGIGADTLAEHLASLQERATNAALSLQAHRSAESSRVSAALAQIEADRDAVRSRAARDKAMRAREERLAREAKESEQQGRMEMDIEVERAERARYERQQQQQQQQRHTQGQGQGSSQQQQQLHQPHQHPQVAQLQAQGHGVAEADDAADDLLDQAEEDEEDEQAALSGHAHRHGYGANDEDEDEGSDDEYQSGGGGGGGGGGGYWGPGRRLNE